MAAQQGAEMIKAKELGRYGWCWNCKENVQSVKVREDYQINDSHMCPECGEYVEEEKEESEE